MLHAFVEGHQYIRAERDLHRHGVLRRKKMLTAIQMRAELYPVGRDLAQFAERKDLEPAGIGQHGAIPAHETVHSPHATDQLMTGPQIQVIGVRQDDLRPAAGFSQGLERSLIHRFDRGGGSHRYEHRGLHDAVGQGEPSPPPAARGGPQNLETRVHGCILVR